MHTSLLHQNNTSITLKFLLFNRFYRLPSAISVSIFYKLQHYISTVLCSDHYNDNKLYIFLFCSNFEYKTEVI